MIVENVESAAVLGGTTYTVFMVLFIALIVIGLALMAIGVILLCRRGKYNNNFVGDEENSTGLFGLTDPEVIISADSQMGDRKYQQDYLAFSSDAEQAMEEETGLLGIVCDGMGGMEGGERASKTCADTLFQGFYQIGRQRDVCRALRELILSANKEVAAFTDESGKKLRSGTTVVTAVIRGSKAYWAAAGDSRIYLFSKGTLRQITTDHNYRLILRERFEAGLIREEDIEADRQKEALISYVGRGADIRIDTGVLDFDAQQGDMLLLCSDGVCKTLSDTQILGLISGNTERPHLLPKLITRAALASGTPGKHDNTTAMIISRN